MSVFTVVSTLIELNQSSQIHNEKIETIIIDEPIIVKLESSKKLDL